MLDNLKIFITVAELKSLTRGAESLGMTIATVSRRLHELEKKLGCELCHRSNKGLTLTNAGQVYYEETASFIHELDIRLYGGRSQPAHVSHSHHPRSIFGTIVLTTSQVRPPERKTK